MEHQAARVPERIVDVNRNDTLLGHDGAIDEIETYNLDDDLLVSLLQLQLPADLCFIEISRPHVFLTNFPRFPGCSSGPYGSN